MSEALTEALTELSSTFQTECQVLDSRMSDRQDCSGQNWKESDRENGGQHGGQEPNHAHNSIRLETDNRGDINNNNNSNSTISSGGEKVRSIEVIRNCRKEESSSNPDSSRDETEFASGGKGVNNNNNITCSQAPVEMKKPGGDSSNNNKRINERAGGAACIVDHLVMEADPTAAAAAKPVPGDENSYTKEQVTLTPSEAPETVTPAVMTVSPEVSFSDPRQSQVFQMLTGVQQLRRNGVFTDVTVRVNDVNFRCHSFVLAINSPFLCAILRDYALPLSDPNHEHPPASQDDVNIKDTYEDNTRGNEQSAGNFERDSTRDKAETPDRTEKSSKGVSPSKLVLTSRNIKGVASPVIVQVWKSEKGDIVLRGLEPDIFAKMLNFMYCCFEDVITEANCLELLLAAESVQLPHLRRTCATYVTDTLSAGNVFRVIQLCDAGYANLFEPRILKRAHQVIRENFPQLSSAEEFLSLGRHVMIPLLADSMLHTRSEMEVLQALLRWVKARPEERCSDMTLMLQHVRFPLMSSRELEKLREVPLLKQNSLAMALIEESRAYGNLDYNERMAWPRHNSISRCLFSTRDLILWTADRDKGLHFYSIIDGQHHKVTSFGQLTAGPQHSTSTSSSSGTPTSSATAISGCRPGASSGNFSFDSTSSVCCYGDKIFFTGGEFNTDMVWSVDTGSGEVKVHAKMPRGRKFHSMVAAKGCVYCLGGQDKRGYTVLEDVDAYIINKDVWVKVGHLAVPAYNMSAAVSGGAVYLVGGFDHSGQPLRLIQCFIALRSGLYSAFKVEISNMPPSLLSARAVACGLDKTIYIVCGHGEVYQFEPDHQRLGLVTTLKNLSENPRVRFGLAYVGGCLVVIGGHQLGHVMHEPIRSVCLDIASKTEVRDYSPLLPGDIVNTCLAAKLSSNILRLFNE